MSLALFDLDETIIDQDSDYAWSSFMIEKKFYDETTHGVAQRKFKSDYLKGKLDIFEYCHFVANNLKKIPLDKLKELREEYLQVKIIPHMLIKAMDTIRKHRNKGDYTILISATNSFLVNRIGQEFDFDHIIATNLEIKDMTFTGQVKGIPSFREGKVTLIQEWLKENPQHSMSESHFYSDSHNDLPLLKLVDHPIPVNPDEKLKSYALSCSWEIKDFRS